MSTVTIRDVAADAGVSTATVSRVLNQDSRVLEDTRLKVIASVEKLGYRIHPVARTLKSGESRLIGVIAPELSNIFWMDLFEHLEVCLHQAGYTMLLSSSSNSVRGEIEQIGYLIDRQVDGLIIIPCGLHSEHFYTIVDKKIPLVFLDRGFIDFPADSVLVNNELGVYEAVTTLINEGHRRIGFVGGDMDQMTSLERYNGYKLALRDAGIPLDDEIVFLSGMVLKSGYYGMKTLLQKKDHPESFFFVSLLASLGAAQYLAKEAPEKRDSLVCAGFDDVFFSSLLPCKYLVAQPKIEMAELAAKMILERIQKTSTVLGYRVVRLRTTLLKEST